MDDPRAHLKKQAADKAARLVEDGMVVELGMGSIATFPIDALDSKLVRHLGERVAVLVEVLPFGREATARRLMAIGAPLQRREKGQGSFVVTDNANIILDCRFGAIDDPAVIERAIVAGEDGTSRFHPEAA